MDQSVNKIRAEVDPEAELIFGAIKDDTMSGKIRVSVVATALDGHKIENKTVLNGVKFKTEILDIQKIYFLIMLEQIVIRWLNQWCNSIKT